MPPLTVVHGFIPFTLNYLIVARNDRSSQLQRFIRYVERFGVAYGFYSMEFKLAPFFSSSVSRVGKLATAN